MPETCPVITNHESPITGNQSPVLSPQHSVLSPLPKAATSHESRVTDHQSHVALFSVHNKLLADQWTPVILVWSCLLLLPFGRLVEVPVVIMAICGIYLLTKRRFVWNGNTPLILFTSVFIATWLPILISLPDAVNQQRTLLVAIKFIRFYFAGLFILHTLANTMAQERFLRLCAWLLLFWLADAIIQSIIGKDLFGFEPTNSRINALFGERHLKFSLTLAFLTPLLWEYARRNWPAWSQISVFIATVYVILVGGARSGWIGISVVITAYLVLIWLRSGRFPARSFAVVCFGSLAIGLVVFQTSDDFARRWNHTMASVTGQVDSGSNPVEHRYWIWKGAITMTKANPFNGVGARGFRYAYADYAGPDDPYMQGQEPTIPTNSHQMLLEISSETGLIGIIGFGFMLYMLIRSAISAPTGTQLRIMPYGLCLVVAFFPFNTHWAYYSSYLSQLLWWLIALYCVAYGAVNTGRPEKYPSPC